MLNLTLMSGKCLQTLKDIQSKTDALLELVLKLPEREDFEHLEAKVDRIADDVYAMKVTLGIHSDKLAGHNQTLDEHAISLQKLNQKAA